MNRKGKESSRDNRLDCSFCGKLFTAIRSRKLHEQSHRICYECYLCSKTFTRKTTLNKHLKKSHRLTPRRASLVCKKCGKSLYMKGINESMKRHTSHHMNVDIVVGWLVGCFGFNGPLRQYFSLYRAVSQREGERGEKG